MACVGVFQTTASAQSVSNWNGSTSGLWSTNSKWDIPPSAAGSAGTIISFLAGNGSITAQQDKNTTTGYNLSQIYLSQTVPDLTDLTNAIPPAIGPTADYTVSGGRINFVAGTIYNPDLAAFSGTGNDSVPFINNAANITTASYTGRLLITAPINFGTATSITLRAGNITGAALFLSGKLTGTGNITVSTFSAGEFLVIDSANNTGFSGNFTEGSSGQVYLGAINALWRQTAINFGSTAAVVSGTNTPAGYGTFERGFNQQHGSVGGAGQYAVATNNATATVLAGFNNNSTTLSGSGGLAGFNVGSHFAKVGTGALTISGTQGAYQAQLSVRDGQIILSGASGSVTNTSALAAGAITTYAGTQIRLINITALNPPIPQGRLSDTAVQRLAGGVLRIDGNGSSAQSETLGSARITSGQSVLNFNNSSPTGPNVSLVFSSLDGSALYLGGQLAVIGTALGSGGSSGSSSVTFTGTLIGLAINGVIPFGLAQTNYVSASGTAGILPVNPNALLERVGSSVRPLATFVDNDFTSMSANERLTSPQIAANAFANSLTTIGGTLTLSGSLTITSGAVLNTGKAVQILGVGPVTTTGRLYLNSSPGNDITIGAPVTATGLSVGGGGSVILAGNLDVGGNTIAVNAGTLTIGTVTGNPMYQVSKGATLTSPALTVGGTLRGNGTVNGTVTVASGGLISASALAGDLSDGQSPGTLTITGGLTLSPGSFLRTFISSVYGDTDGSTTNGQYTQSKILATTLTFTGNYATNKITIQPHSLALSNTGTAAIYDYLSTEEYFWTLGTFSGGITNFSSDKFAVDKTFQSFSTNNPLGVNGSYEVITQGNNLVLHYIPTPEPVFLALPLFSLFLLRRRRNAAMAQPVI